MKQTEHPRRYAVLAAVALMGAGFHMRLNAEPAPVTQLDAAQSTYLQRCGGCHGIQGTSNPAVVPTLRGQVSQFLCTRQGREYLVRLPSIATSPLSDRQLADLMNFVVFSLGGTSSDELRAPPFSAAEIGRLRRRPLNEVALVKFRADVVEDLIRKCGASPALRAYSEMTPRSR